jgi:hypothetical protein
LRETRWRGGEDTRGRLYDLARGDYTTWRGATKGLEDLLLFASNL